MEESDSCPLCCEDLDITERNFRPCKCGYQVCLWCWRKISESSNPVCPACRQEYKKENIEFVTPDQQALENAAQEKKKKKKSDRSRGNSEVVNSNGVIDKSKLYNIRVLQRNLLYVVGLPTQLAKEEILKRKDGFGKFGKIVKVAVNPKKLVGNSVSYSAYVTYRSEVDAARAIQALNGGPFHGRYNLRATYGTTKYCAYFLRNTNCNNPNCLYLHELAREEDCVTKDDLSIQSERTSGGRKRSHDGQEEDPQQQQQQERPPSLEKRTSRTSSSPAPVVNQWASPPQRVKIAASSAAIASSSSSSSSTVDTTAAAAVPASSKQGSSSPRDSSDVRRGWSEKSSTSQTTSSSSASAVDVNGHAPLLTGDPRATTTAPPAVATTTTTTPTAAFPATPPQQAQLPPRQATPQERQAPATTTTTSTTTPTTTSKPGQYANTNSISGPTNTSQNTTSAPPGNGYTRAIGNERKHVGMGRGDARRLDSLFVAPHERKHVLHANNNNSAPFDFNKFIQEMSNGSSLFSWSSPLTIFDHNHNKQHPRQQNGRSIYSFAQQQNL